MFGFGNRKRELDGAAKRLAAKLIRDAVLEDTHRQGVPADVEPAADEHRRLLAAWAAQAPMRWEEAKRGDPDALRQTARNYLFGTGVRVDPRKARLWVEAARLVEADATMDRSALHPFWKLLEEELNGILTVKERFRAGEDAMHWVKGFRQVQLRSGR